ncbi:WD40 repeat-like protein [Mycena rebaudengoi]|nr:WD40 repeat-like protein [Mycena rebaudengoi]
MYLPVAGVNPGLGRHVAATRGILEVIRNLVKPSNVLQHDPAVHLPQRPGDPAPTSRNLNPLMHPFARARERTRALNAAKMDRMFAKPFVDSLEGHVDAVETMARQPGALTTVASGSWDGGMCVPANGIRFYFYFLCMQASLCTTWRGASKLLHVPQAHAGKVAGVCFSRAGRLFSCGVDKTVKLWNVEGASSSPSDANPSLSSSSSTQSPQPVTVYTGKSPFNSIDHHNADPLFATASNVVQVWDETRSLPLSTLSFPTSAETITALRFNASETSVLASVGSDRTFALYDIRTGKAERRVVMQMSANALSWSPTLPTLLLLASEDHNLYTFDLRHLTAPTQVYKGHVAPATSCDWAPTGLSFVSGGWDRTVRIWEEGRGHAPEVYHTKRMGRVSAALFTSDARFVLSGSDDGNVRLWKADASARLGVVAARERAAIEYRATLKERWKVDKEVGRVVRSRHVPRAVHQASSLKRTMLDAQRVKEERRRKHTRAGAEKPRAERKKLVVVEQA